MVDRRKLIVGTGAAALTVAVGSPAKAVSPGALQRITQAHAQQIFDLVNVDRGLVRPAGVQELFQRGWATCLDSRPRDPRDEDLHAWTQQRMLALCGTDDFAAAGTKYPQTRALLGFSVLAYSQQQDPDLPQITRSMPVPDALARLEPEFLPVLVGRINDAADRSRAFADALGAGTAEMDRIVAEHMGRSSQDAKARSTNQMSNGDMLNMTIGILGFISFLYWIKRGLK